MMRHYQEAQKQHRNHIEKGTRNILVWKFVNSQRELSFVDPKVSTLTGIVEGSGGGNLYL